MMKTYAELVEELERYKRVMNEILSMEEYTSTFDNSYYPVSVKEAKKLILGLEKPEEMKKEIIVNQDMINEAYDKIVQFMSNE